MIRWWVLCLAVSAAALSGCGREEHEGPPAPTALTDTLGGFRLGMLRAEAEAAAAARGDTLICTEARPVGEVKRARCSWGPEASRVELLNNQLVSVRMLAAPDADSVAPAAIAARLEAGGYGPPAFELHGRDISYPYRSFWIGADSSSRLELFCPDTVAASGCQIVTRLATPAQIRRLARGG